MNDAPKNDAPENPHRRLLFGAASGLILLLAACGSSGTPSQQSAASSAVSSAVSSTVSSAVSSSVSAGGTTTVQGTVTKGVENGCVVLVDASGTAVANLQGWDLQAHPFGSQVEVTGAFEPDLMTTCQQGTPFAATAVVSR